MRVIKNPPMPNYGGQFVCSGCQAILAYEKTDIRHKRHDPDSEYVVCPFCKKEKDVTKDVGH